LKVFTKNKNLINKRKACPRKRQKTFFGGIVYSDLQQNILKKTKIKSILKKGTLREDIPQMIVERDIFLLIIGR